jgi:hypothetical protein
MIEFIQRGWKVAIGVALVVALVILSFKDPLPPSEKEQNFHKKALVLTTWQTWDEVGDDILELFEVSEDKSEWSSFQYFGGDDGFKGLIDSENYKKWRQCIFRKGNMERTFCREEEWAFKESTMQWLLVNRSFYEDK